MATGNVIDAVLDALEAVVIYLVRLMPAFTPPSWMDPAPVGDFIADAAEFAAPFRGWVPFAVIGAVTASVFSTYIAVLVLQGAMKIYAMVRGGAS